MLQYILPTSSYLLHSEPRLSKSLLQTQRTSWVFLHLFYRYWMFWFIGQCHSFADILFYFFATSSYLLPLNQGFKFTTSNTRNLKGILSFILQTFKVLVYWTMSFFCRHVTVHLHDFLILVSSKTKVFKVTNSNTIMEPQRFSGIYLTDIWSSGLFGNVILLQTGSFCRISFILKPRFKRSQLQTQEPHRVF